MHPLMYVSSLWLLYSAVVQKGAPSVDGVPRRELLYHGDNARLFHEEGVSNYTALLLREDLGLLIVGARDAVYALDLVDISKKNASVQWGVTQQIYLSCETKTEQVEVCRNYIKLLHKIQDNKMYVCGTSAFNPQCDYLLYSDGRLTLEKNIETGVGKCPFDPFQGYASIMVENHMYSATTPNFLGTVFALIRSSIPRKSDFVPLSTEHGQHWFYEPEFVSLSYVPESVDNDGDDDKVYLFFREKPVEENCFDSVVSRVARVCRGDLGGRFMLQRRWTTFLKARLDCPVLKYFVPYIIQDAFLQCDPQEPKKLCLFYAIFTPQFGVSDQSAVCVFKLSDINKVFDESMYIMLLATGDAEEKWVRNFKDVPVPRPGACINNEARKLGINLTLDIPASNLAYLKNSPLMADVIEPVGLAPLLTQRGVMFTRIVVTQVQAVDSKKYHVMFIGTEDGAVVKAVTDGGETFIIEHVQLFVSPVKINNLIYSSVTGQIYAASDNGVAQMPVATCGRSSSCLDCVLSRDPYCGWDRDEGKCKALSSAVRELIQSVRDGNATLCPEADPVTPVSQFTSTGEMLKLDCFPPSNLANTSWEHNGQAISSPRHVVQQDGLLILYTLESDTGRYRCLSMERTKSNWYTSTIAEYQVTVSPAIFTRNCTAPAPKAQHNTSVESSLKVLVLLLAVFLGIWTWNFYKGYILLPCRKRPPVNEPVLPQT